jgi:hypothetical protein
VARARLREAGLDSAEYPASVATAWLINVTQLAGERPTLAAAWRVGSFPSVGPAHPAKPPAVAPCWSLAG